MGRNVEHAGRRANPALAAPVVESASSYAGLARRVNELALKQGLKLRYDKVGDAVAGWQTTARRGAVFHRQRVPR